MREPDYDFEFEDAMRDAYGPADPKHPDFLEALVDWVDMTRKAEKENGENPNYGPGNPDWQRDFDKTAGPDPDDPALD